MQHNCMYHEALVNLKSQGFSISWDAFNCCQQPGLGQGHNQALVNLKRSSITVSTMRPSLIWRANAFSLLWCSQLRETTRLRSRIQWGLGQSEEMQHNCVNHENLVNLKSQTFSVSWDPVNCEEQPGLGQGYNEALVSLKRCSITPRTMMPWLFWRVRFFQSTEMHSTAVNNQALVKATIRP